MKNLAFFLCVFATPSWTFAQPHIDHIAPPTVRRGEPTLVTFHGKNLANAFDVWHSSPFGNFTAKLVEATATKAVFQIETNAQIGIVGLRLATRDGLSNLHLFLIDDVATSYTGTFREGVVDRYPLLVKAGEFVSFEIVASRFGKDADPLITIKDAQGRWVAERDNDPGLFFDCRFAHRFEKAGQYTVEVRDARFEGSPAHHYVLRTGRFPAGRVALPAAVRVGENQLFLPEVPGSKFDLKIADRLPGPFDVNLSGTWAPTILTDGHIAVALDRDPVRDGNRALAMASVLGIGPRTLGWLQPLFTFDRQVQYRAVTTPAEAPGTFSGVLRQPGDRHAFAFDLAKGQSIFVRAEAQSLQSPADLDVTLTDRAGKEIRRAQDKPGEFALDYTATAPGNFRLVVRDQLQDGSPAHTYRLTVRETPFPPSIQAEVEGLTVPQGSYQPVPLTVNRGTYTGPILLKLLNAPAGLKLVPSEIGEKENAIVCKLEADAKVPAGVHAVQILAETPLGTTLVRTQPLVDKQLINVDQILLALREDQKRLPASVTDRLAVQIVPASPFAMEINEATINLPRYQTADVPIAIERRDGFQGSIEFAAKGGQLGDPSEGRTRVYAEFPEGKADQPVVHGTIVSKILTNLTKSRIEVTGVAQHDGRRVSLTRTFDLLVTAAFSVKAEPAKVSLLPGETARVRLIASRVKSFAGDVRVHIAPYPGLMLPDSLVIPAGQSEGELEIAVPPDALPRKQNLQANVTGIVNGYEEEQRGVGLEIEVRKK